MGIFDDIADAQEDEERYKYLEEKRLSKIELDLKFARAERVSEWIRQLTHGRIKEYKDATGAFMRALITEGVSFDNLRKFFNFYLKYRFVNATSIKMDKDLNSSGYHSRIVRILIELLQSIDEKNLDGNQKMILMKLMAICIFDVKHAYVYHEELICIELENQLKIKSDYMQQFNTVKMSKMSDQEMDEQKTVRHFLARVMDSEDDQNDHITYCGFILLSDKNYQDHISALLYQVLTLEKMSSCYEVRLLRSISKLLSEFKKNRTPYTNAVVSEL